MEAYLKAAVPINAINGFAKTGTFPFNPDVFTETDFIAAATTEMEFNEDSSVVEVPTTSSNTGQLPATDPSLQTHKKVVLNLLSKYVNKGYSVYMDNFYNSVNLAQKLLTLKTYCSGTLRVNRKNNPKEVSQRKLKRGESIAKFNSSGICVLKWKDRRDVLMISS